MIKISTILLGVALLVANSGLSAEDMVIVEATNKNLILTLDIHDAAMSKLIANIERLNSKIEVLSNNNNRNNFEIKFLREENEVNSLEIIALNKELSLTKSNLSTRKIPKITEKYNKAFKEYLKENK